MLSSVSVASSRVLSSTATCTSPPPEPFSVVRLDLDSGKWERHVTELLPQLTFVRLVSDDEGEGKLYLVGGIGADGICRSIKVWELKSDGSDIAWKDAKYAQIWEYLRDEFELTQRFASLDFKLKFVEHNIRFLQEILQNRKSDFLEWLIIALIGAEILLSLYDIVQRSGMKF
ncbi:hypothetical protein V8G54_030142 [Vigna mungo]|uniref:DUF155 domain-containing protein n=1 Tax=Vigna mungo TaxID=3915 RepID=A0AAQ3RL00_VIGMU